MYQLLIFLSVVTLATSAQSQQSQFLDYDIYKIETKLFADWVLTVKIGPQNLTDLPKIAAWNDTAGQKWRLESAKLFTAFQLRPTSYESFILEQKETDTFLEWVASVAQFGNHKLWYLNDAGHGFTQIKNKHFDTCLAANEQDFSITTATCSNSNDQQWKFTKI